MFLALFPSFLGQYFFDPKLFMLFALVWAFVVFGWVCIIGIEANSRLKDTLKISPKPMFCGLAYTLVYMIYFTSVVP